jgi:glycosyltransferase involved in cell wall biosynthesis
MKVAVYPADLGGCGFYRMANPARALADQGFDVDLIQPDEPEERQMAAWFVDTDHGPKVADMRPPDADIVVMQRPLAQRTVATIEYLQAHGIRVVVEIDDDFEAIDRRNTSWPRVQPSANSLYNRDHLRRGCEIADLVTATTPALAERYGAHGRVAVLPNYVPEAYTHIDTEPHDGIIVGWSGSIDTHPRDLQQCGAGVAQAIASTGAQFAVIGTGKGVQKALNLRDQVRACGWQPLEEYPHAMAQLDIGLVPLDITPFNQAKSWLKGLEFAALGVPFIASPTDPYQELARYGLGVLADKPKRWRSKLTTMIDAPGRQALAEAGREVVRDNLTIERNAERWWDAWALALDAKAAA